MELDLDAGHGAAVRLPLALDDLYLPDLEAVGDVALSLLGEERVPALDASVIDRKSTRLNSSHANISYAVFCLKKKKSHSGSIVPTRTGMRTIMSTTVRLRINSLTISKLLLSGCCFSPSSRSSSL